MITNSSPWDNLKFDEAGVQEVSRTFFGKLFQTYSFLAMYANVDGFDGTQPRVSVGQRPEIDRWILSELNSLVKRVTACYEDYEPTRAGRLVENFVIDNLSNWFVRLSRKRFWAKSMDADKLSAYQALYECLLVVSKLIAPISPFYADRLYRDLVGADRVEDSVHLTKFPVPDDSQIDTELESRMEMAQKVTSMVLSLRKKEHIIVRQPLQCISIPVVDVKQKEYIEAVKQLILDEVNVRELHFVDGGMLVKTVKCNFRVMGKKYGKLMKDVAGAVATLSQADIARLEQDGSLTIDLGGNAVVVERADVEIVSEDIPGWTVANEGNLTVALDLEITDDLKDEGVAREIVKRIQAYRKESGFEITDRIAVTIQARPEIDRALSGYRDYIAGQVLADSIEAKPDVDGDVLDFDGFSVKVNIQKSKHK